MNGVEYIIVGDSVKYPEHTECLIYTCGRDKEWAEKVLDRMLTNPNDNDKLELENHRNIKVKEVNSKDCWWNYGTD